MLRNASELLAPAVTETIAALKLAGEDAAAVRLAQRYAAAIDAAEDHAAALDRLGPKLLAVLESLGATPDARTRLKKGRPSAGKPSGLAALQAHRA